MFNRSPTLSERREGFTQIILPDIGRTVCFERFRAGDFFMDTGRLYLKTNLTDAVEIPNGSTPMVGTNQFSADHLVKVVRAKIELS